MDPLRLELAEEFLREAVYRSRARQAFDATREPGSAAAPGNCGLGAGPSVALELSPRGQELLERLWSGAAPLERIQGLMRGWVERQDALDRKRNHFLKAFRGQHGFDRTRYTPEQLAEFEAGLARVNDEEDRLRRAAALELGAQP